MKTYLYLSDIHGNFKALKHSLKSAKSLKLFIIIMTTLMVTFGAFPKTSI